ncbi:MAG: hypothetical protein JW781_07205 [Deltaproteobacteria bacterium]|nr:hypothetical protein [Candidatus Anaeroferrophillacea bacterium]
MSRMMAGNPSRISKVFLLLFGLVPLLAACGILPQRVRLQPTATGTVPAAPGAGRPVFVEVVDHRPAADLGWLAAGGPEDERRPISSADRLDDVLLPLIVEALKQAGFRPVLELIEADRSLVVAVEECVHTVGNGMVRVPVTTRVILAAEAAVNGDRHRSVATVDFRGETAFRPAPVDTERQINGAIGAAVDKLCANPALWEFLGSH